MAESKKDTSEKDDKGGASATEPLLLAAKFKEEDRYFLPIDSVIEAERQTSALNKMYSIAMYGSLKVKLNQLHETIKKNVVSEDSISQHLRHYLKKDLPTARVHLKTIAIMLINQARVKGQKAGIQIVLVFKAVDCLRMVIQYSDDGVDAVTSYMILQIISRLPKAFIPHMNREKEIFNQNLALQRAVKENLPTIAVRNRLASLYNQQKCFTEVLYQHEQILQYFINKKPQTKSNREKICVININIAELYRSITIFDGEFKNGQILQNFIHRYNRDVLFNKNREPLTTITGPINKMTVKNTFKELSQLSVNHFEIALKFFPANKNRKKRSEIYVILGENYLEMNKDVDACISFQDALLLLGKERNSDEGFAEKYRIIQLMKKSAGHIKDSSGDKYKSFVVKEANKLESDRLEWKEDEQRRQKIRTGSSKKW